MSVYLEREHYDIAIVGGGLAGLTAAATLGRGGRTVVVLERAAQPGGRAATRTAGGFRFNLGPHALYRAGAALPILQELGVALHGGVVPTNAANFVRGGRLISPLGALWSNRLLGARDKLAAARFFATLGRIDAAESDGLSLERWAEQHIRSAAFRQLFYALTRLNTYANAPAQQSAGATLAQIQRGLRSSVIYVDGGWQTLVDGLAATTRAAGGQIVTGARAVGVEHGSAMRGVRLADGGFVGADAVVLALEPAEAAALLPPGSGGALRRWAATAVPTRVATLDVGLARLPRPRTRVVLGVDAPLYLSVHSAWAQLAPAGGALIHVAKYLGPQAASGDAVLAELEALLDLAQPGWRAQLVERRFRPHLTVSNALVTAAQGGLAGRPGPAIPDVPGLYVAGDWVGPVGMLADAAVASGRAAADLILRRDVLANPKERSVGVFA